MLRARIHFAVRLASLHLLASLLVMLAARDVTLADVEAELARRAGTSGITEKAARG